MGFLPGMLTAMGIENIKLINEIYHSGESPMDLCRLICIAWQKKPGANK